MTDDDPKLQRLAKELRQEPPLDSTLDQRVMALVRQHGPAAGRSGLVVRFRDWLLEPRTLRLSPLAGMAAAALVLIIIAASVSLSRHQPARTIADGAISQPEWVRFVFTAPGAAQVSLVGDFNDWDPAATPLHATAADGVWSISVPLSAGRHEYAFVVDGADWRPDPAAPPAARSDFGTPNSVVTVADRL